MDHKWLTQQNKGLKAHQSSMICSGDSKQGFGEKMFFFFFHQYWYMYMNKAVLYVKLKGPQCSDIQGAQHMISMQKKIFLVTQEQKLGAMGHQALLEHSFEEITQIRNK